MCLKKTSIQKKERQNWIKNDRVMPNAHLMFMRNAHLTILAKLISILAKLVDMDFKFVLPVIYINFGIQTNFEVNQTQIDYNIISKKSLNLGFFGFWAQMFLEA